jgi:lipoate-protein ligase B
VGYPLLPLGVLPKGEHDQIPKADYVGFIRKLEQVIIAAVAEFGIKGQSIQGLTGVWVTDEPSADSSQSSVSSHPTAIAKLAAIGVKVDARGITQHGFAININPDMRYWEGIIGCGLTYPEISLAQLLDPVPTREMVMDAVIQAFGQVFNFDIQEKEFTSK